MIQQQRGGSTVMVEDSERQPCEVWTRVMGYYRPKTSMNIGKQQEQRDRKLFKEEAVL